MGAQIVGCNPEVMGEAAAIIESMGFDLLDINMGCPVPKITGPGGGSALLKEPDTAKNIFQSVMRNIKKIPVTVKMRKGYCDDSGQEAVQIARAAEDAGLSAVSVHGRTRAQGYSGKADWEAIGRVASAVRIPVFGNGDINTPEDAKRIKEISGCEGVMLGRGALGNPWLYRSIESALQSGTSLPGPSLEEKKRVALEHFELELRTEGERIGLLKSRRILCWYLRDYPGSPELRNRINHSESAQEMRELVRDFQLAP